MEIEDIRKLSREDRQKTLTETRQTLAKLNMQRGSGDLKDVAQFKKHKKTIARLLTVENAEGA